MSDETDQVPDYIEEWAAATQIFDQVRARQEVPEEERLRAKKIVAEVKELNTRLANTPSDERAVMVDASGNITGLGPDGRYVSLGTVQEEARNTQAVPATQPQVRIPTDEFYGRKK